MAISVLYSAAELTEWRRRDAQGEYASNWARVVGNANTLNTKTIAQSMVDPASNSNEIFWHTQTTVTETFYNEQTAEQRPFKEGTLIRDAAFVRLVKEVNTYDTKLHDFIMYQIQHPSVDFSNRTMWTYELQSTAPYFNVSEWVTRIVTAYEYCQDLFSSGEQTIIETWLYNAMDFWYTIVNQYFDIVWVDRDNDDYTPTGWTNAVHSNNIGLFVTHVGGHPCSAAMVYRYTNRIMSLVRAYGRISFYLNNTTVKTSLKRVYEEFLKYWAFSDGLVIELERGSTSQPEQSFYYSFQNTLEMLLEVANWFGREGDTSLFSYETTDGFYTTGDDPTNGYGGTKNILKVMTAACQLRRDAFLDPLTGLYSIYAKIIDATHKIDGYDAVNVWSGQPAVYPIAHFFFIYNCYFQDAYINASADIALNVGGVALNNMSSWVNDQGPWGTTPSMEFMRWDMDSILNPYSESNPDPPEVPSSYRRLNTPGAFQLNSKYITP